jgi:hypothetical protein
MGLRGQLLSLLLLPLLLVLRTADVEVAPPRQQVPLLCYRATHTHIHTHTGRDSAAMLACELAHAIYHSHMRTRTCPSATENPLSQLRQNLNAKSKNNMCLSLGPRRPVPCL